MRVAPRLYAYHLDKKARRMDLAEDYEGQVAELRALLAVARAGRSWARSGLSMKGYLAECDKLRSALARLEKVSGREP